MLFTIQITSKTGDFHGPQFIGEYRKPSYARYAIARLVAADPKVAEHLDLRVAETAPHMAIVPRRTLTRVLHLHEPSRTGAFLRVAATRCSRAPAVA